MNIDWSTVLDVVTPLIALVVGGFVTELFRRKPKLFTYYGHVSAFKLQNATPPMAVNTHSVVIVNSGRLAAKNVRLTHHNLPVNYEVVPPRPFHVQQHSTGNGADIVFSELLPKEQVTVSYLYFPPLIWTHVNGQVKSDEGFAKVLNVLPTPQAPKWLMRLVYLMLFVGVASTTYLGVEGAIWIAKISSDSAEAGSNISAK